MLMDAKQVLRADFDRARLVTNMLLEDMDDADLLVRPTENSNHIAWQLGHLIGAENRMGESIKPSSMPALPEGFAQHYTAETASSDNADDFLSKAEYLRLMDEQRGGILQLLDELTDEDLEREGPESMRRIAPTVSDLLGLAASHEMMHTGQITSVRRKLGKPNVM
jgi:uncharacterized damage-inducible protein DinB